MAMLRVFTAIPLPEGLIRKIDQSIRRNLHSPIRPVEAEALHITLNFIGDVEDRETPQLCRELGNSIQDIAAFPVALSGFGGFPHLDRPRVVWIGVNEGNEELLRLNRRLRDKIEEFGFTQEKRYKPHLTIGRLAQRTIETNRLEQIRSAFERHQWPPFEAKSVTVFNSILEKAGPTYIPLATLPLAKG